MWMENSMDPDLPDDLDLHCFLRGYKTFWNNYWHIALIKLNNIFIDTQYKSDYTKENWSI